jgi:hypothetical protein
MTATGMDRRVQPTDAMPVPISDGDLASEPGVAREPLGGPGGPGGPGASGATLERIRMPDGRTLIRKAFDGDSDWMMRATHDPGRAATLWTSGVMDRLPPDIDSAIVRIERGSPGPAASWVLYMEDVSSHFLRRGTIVGAGECRRLLRALAAMHAAFAGLEPSSAPPSADLCSLDDLLRLASPTTVERAAGGHPFIEIVRSGWAAFDELAPDDLRIEIHGILDDPTTLADALRAEPSTLVHADPHYGNIAPAPDRFYLIDWGLAAWAPAAVDFAWWLDQSSSFLGPSREELLVAFRLAESGRYSEQALELALLAELVLAGWQYDGALRGADPDLRARRRADFDWWVGRARAGLERLG